MSPKKEPKEESHYNFLSLHGKKKGKRVKKGLSEALAGVTGLKPKEDNGESRSGPIGPIIASVALFCSYAFCGLFFDYISSVCTR